MLDIPLIVLSLKRLNILFEQTLVEPRLSDIMQESCEHDVLCRLTVEAHPLREDAREDRNAERVVVDVARQMVDLVQIVDRPAAARERQQLFLHHLVGLFDRHIPCPLCLFKDGLCRPDDVLILLDKEVAAREDGRAFLLQLGLILNVDNGNLEKFETRDVRLRQLCILRHDHHTLGVDDRSRKYHSIFQIIHGYCTQCKPSLGLRC